jgi:2-oxoglutarate ferredoxin oxidoreductase subunit beta
MTKSTPMGSVDQPFNPISVAIGAEATFVARAIDTDKKELTEVLRRAAEHKGAAFVEVFQNCNIYNDNAFDQVREEKENRIYLRHGEPIRFGAEGEKGVVRREDGSVAVVEAATVPADQLLIHDEHAEEPSLAFALSRLTLGTVGAAPMGIFRDVTRPVYNELVEQQLNASEAQKGQGDLKALIASGDTWAIA